MIRCSRWPVAVACLVALLGVPQPALPWGGEGHRVIIILAEHFMRPETVATMRRVLAPETPEQAAEWADAYRGSHRETSEWHYIDIPLRDSTIDMARECPHGDCVVAKTEEFIRVLQDPSVPQDRKAEALKFVIHFIGDLHQPLHAADDGDRGGNSRLVIFDGGPENLHWVWDTGLLRDDNRDASALASILEARITPRGRLAWQKGTIDDWVIEAHAVAQRVAYGELPRDGNPVRITSHYERDAQAAMEFQLEKSGVRLASVLDRDLVASAGSSTVQQGPRLPKTGKPGAMVWVNTKSGAYHCSGSRWYGNTKHGEYMTQAKAQNSGYRPAQGMPCK